MELFKKLEQEVGEWSQDNFPDQPAINPFVGSSEEAGEFADRIDLTTEPNEDELDAVGDILVYLADFCSKREFGYQEAYERSKEVENKHSDFFREWVGSYGQLSRSVLKREQGIRLDEDRVGTEAEQKAVSRILSNLESMVTDRGYTLEDAIQVAWYDEVIDRYWDSSYKH